MDSNSRRHRHRTYRRDYSPVPRHYSSSSSYRRHFSPDDDDEDHLQQEIIHRAMQIERSRDEILRRQFELIVDNVKELERRRYYRHRIDSPDFTHRRIHSHSLYRDSSPERFHRREHFQNRRRRRRSSSRSKEREEISLAFQISLIYRPNGNENHGDEIMILEDHQIVFKGFLREKEKFSFKIRSSDSLNDRVKKCQFYLNDLFEFSLMIDLENEQIRPRNEFLQLEQIRKTNRKLSNEKRALNSESETSISRDDQHRTTSGKSKPLKAKVEENPNRSKSQTTSNRRPPPPVPSSPPLPPSTSRKHQSQSDQRLSSTTRSTQRTTNSTHQLSKPAETNQLAIESSDNSENEDKSLRQKENVEQKRTYGPPQLSTFARSDSDSTFTNERLNLSKQHEEEEEEENAHQNDQEEKSSPSKENLLIAEKKEEEEQEQNGDEQTDSSGGFVNFLQLLQTMSGGAGRSPSSNDETDGIQNFLARLGIVTQTNSTRKKRNLAPRNSGNVENFLLIYLDSSRIDEEKGDELKSLVNSMKTFEDADDCVALINSILNDKVILIVSDQLGDPVVSRIQDLQQLFKIYVLCQNEEQLENWSTNQPKIGGIFLDFDQLIEQIRIDVNEEEENLLTLSITSTRSNQKEDSNFLLFQMIKEILLDQDEINDAKKELVDFARQEYQNNAQQLKSIEQFEENYSKENLLEFYSNKSFISKMLSRGFRVPDVDILYKLRLFIQHLHQLIETSSSQTNLTIKTLYRTQTINKDEFETLKKHSDGGFLSFNQFFKATIHRPEEEISSSASSSDEEKEEILFQIDLSNNSNSFLIINDDEVLMDFCLVCRIENLSKDKTGRTLVQLKLISSTDPQIENLLEPMRKEIRAPYPSLRIIKLFIEFEEFSLAVHLGQILLADCPQSKRDSLLALARLYHSLGTTLYEKEDYDQALDVIQKSHALYLRFLPEDAPQLSPTWNNMGSIYLRQGKTDLALEYHEKALAIQLKSPSPDLASIISYSNNIGGVYLKLERYDEALLHFKRALQIEEQTLSKNNPELAGTYHRIGGVYFRQNNYEQALEYYDKTLEIELASLPDNHPTVAVTYHNRGTALEGLGKLDEAVESAENAVQRLLKTLPKEHPQVRMNQAYVDRLKQKLWVKQLFSS